MPHSGPTRRSSSLIYHPGLLKPGSARWRAALLAARLGKPCLPLPGPGLTLIPAGEKFDQMGARIAGFRVFGDQMLRIDMAERMARTAHEAIAKNEAFTAQSPQTERKSQRLNSSH